MSGFHFGIFLSPSVSWLLTASPSLPFPLSLHVFLFLSSSCSLLPAASHSPSHSFTQPSPPPPPSLMCVSLSQPSSFPPAHPLLLLISPSLSLYLTFSPFFFLFFLSLLPFTRLLHGLSSHSLTLFPASLPPSLHLCLCFCSHSALQCFCLILCFSILFSFLNLAQFSFFSFLFSFLHLNVCLCGDQ